MNKLISVIIPTYNRASLVIDAINTVINQTYQDFEIIIIDDGSTDNTEQVIKGINDLRIRYIYQENSGKPSCARNNGIRKAKGEYIAFLDSDDLWHPQMLEKNISILNNNNKIGFVTNWSSYRTFEGNEIKKKICYAKNKNEYMSYLLLSPDKAYAGPSTILVKKECFEKAGCFDEEMTFCEDWDMFFRIALFYEMHNLEEVLTYVRVHQESLSKTPEVTKFREGYLRFLEKAFENKNLPTEILNIKNKAYSNALWCIGGWALHKSKEFPVARESLLKSLKYSYTKLFDIKFLIALILSHSPVFMLNIYENIKSPLKKLLGKKH